MPRKVTVSEFLNSESKCHLFLYIKPFSNYCNKIVTLWGVKLYLHANLSIQTPFLALIPPQRFPAHTIQAARRVYNYPLMAPSSARKYSSAGNGSQIASYKSQTLIPVWPVNASTCKWELRVTRARKYSLRSQDFLHPGNWVFQNQYKKLVFDLLEVCVWYLKERLNRGPKLREMTAAWSTKTIQRWFWDMRGC